MVGWSIGFRWLFRYSERGGEDAGGFGWNWKGGWMARTAVFVLPARFGVHVLPSAGVAAAVLPLGRGQGEGWRGRLWEGNGEEEGVAGVGGGGLGVVGYGGGDGAEEVGYVILFGGVSTM